MIALRPSTSRPVAVQPASRPISDCLLQVKSCLLLSGSVRPDGFRAAIGRSVLDLPLARGCSLLDLWQGHAEKLARLANANPLVVRVVTDHTAHAPAIPAACNGRVAFTLERDPSELRGTGGVVSDAVRTCPEDEYVVVASAGLVLLEPLADLVLELAATGADAALFSNDDGAPSSLLLIRCGCLRLVPQVGFVDLKEQALPLIAKRHVVKVIRRRRPVGLPLRTAGDYLAATRCYHRWRTEGETPVDPFDEDWAPVVSLAEDGALVAATAQVHDSVVLRGARVEAGAVLVRSLVCPGATVRGGRTVIDQLIAGGKDR